VELRITRHPPRRAGFGQAADVVDAEKLKRGRPLRRSASSEFCATFVVAIEVNRRYLLRSKE
jgi:hypothetical protein